MAGEAEWRQAAQALGLSLVEPTGSFNHSDGFEQVRRSFGRASGDRALKARWLAGKSHVPPMQRDVEVVILQDVHVSRQGEHETRTVHTHVLAAIDPPLFFGLDLQLWHGWEPFGHAPTLPTGDPQFDDAFRLRALVQGPTQRLFQRQVAPPNDLVDHLLAIQRVGTVNVCDSHVNVQLGEQLNLSQLAPAVASSTALAALIGHRRANQPYDADEQQRHTVWRAFAGSQGFQYDDNRFVMTGTLEGGSHLRIAVETELSKFFTIISVAPPTLLNLGLKIYQQGALSWLGGIFGAQDIRVGDAAFDEAFVIKGANEPAVRAFLQASPIARQALLELVRFCPSVELNDTGLYLRPLQMADGQTLHRLTQLARAVATLFVRR